MNTSSSAKAPAAKSEWKVTALIGALTGFVTAVAGLIAAISAFPNVADKIFPERRESGFIRTIRADNQTLDRMKFGISTSEACKLAQITYVQLRQALLPESKLKELDITKSFDQEDDYMARSAKFRTLAQIFITSNDISALAVQAARNGCLLPN